MKTIFALLVASAFVSLGIVLPFTPPNKNPVRVMHIETREATASPTVPAITETETPIQPALIEATPTPFDPRAPREGFPVWGYGGPIIVTPAGTLYPFAWATPCNPWIDANTVLFCVMATVPPQVDSTPWPTHTALPGYPAP
jgi:hypothetical protein